MSSHLRPVTHAIFDVDGLILDTESLYSDIMDTICEQHGKKFTWDIKARMMGQSTKVAARILIEALDLPITVEDYSQMVFREQEKTFPEAKLMPGAEKLIRHLHAHNIPMALASGSGQHEFELKISKHQELFDMFQHAVLSSTDPEVTHSKPAPDCFLVAANRFVEPASPENCIVFEDAPNGVQGAVAAGMQCVWVPDPKMDTTALQSKASVILHTLTEFEPEQFGLPPYNDST